MSKTSLYIMIGILALLIMGGVYAFFTTHPATVSTTSPPNGTSPTICTMEAKICPDGSAVGRTGPNCEFAPCPTR